VTQLLERAGASFLRAFAVTFLAFATGILGATNTQAATALSIAALAASVAAGLRAVQVFVPQLTFAAILPQPWAAYVDAFVRTFVGTFLATITGWLAAPNWSTWHAAVLGALTGAAVAALRAVQGFFTLGETPQPPVGLKDTPKGLRLQTRTTEPA
jgi:phospholipase C